VWVSQEKVHVLSGWKQDGMNPVVLVPVSGWWRRWTVAPGLV
jgi:hypothetical protein